MAADVLNSSTSLIAMMNSTMLSQLDESELRVLCALRNDTVPSSMLSVDGAHTRPSPFIVWTLGLSFVTIINMCAVIGIGVMRYLSKNVYNQVITFFVGLGVGSLSGSSFYHLLPQAHPSLVEGGNHEYLTMAHFSVIGVYTFFLADKLIKVILQRKKHVKPVENWDGIRRVSGKSDASLLCKPGGDMGPNDIEFTVINDASSKSMGDQAHGICSHEHELQFTAGDSAIAAVAWMIVFGDGLHNLIDGISIGAAFAESIHSGLSLSLAVLAEEFPHELGDVAILVASGLTLKQALLYNLLSALTCYVGFFIGVFIGDLDPQNARYLFALAGGMFLYISLSCMMPEMKKAMEEALNVSLAKGIYVFFLQVMGLFCGLTLMFTMSRYGGDISI